MNGRYVVLVVDDERQSQEALRRALEDEMEVLCASAPRTPARCSRASSWT